MEVTICGEDVLGIIHRIQEASKGCSARDNQRDHRDALHGMTRGSVFDLCNAQFTMLSLDGHIY